MYLQVLLFCSVGILPPMLRYSYFISRRQRISTSLNKILLFFYIVKIQNYKCILNIYMCCACNCFFILIECVIQYYVCVVFFFFNIFLTVHPNIMIVFFTNLIHKFFILIHLLYSCTCFEHYYAHLQHYSCVNTASGTVTLFG